MGWSWLGVTHEVVARMLARVTDNRLKDLPGLEDPLTRGLVCMAGEMGLAVGRRAQFLGLWAPPMWLLENAHGMVASFP